MMKIALTATPNDPEFTPLLVRKEVVQAFEWAKELGYEGVELHLRKPTDIDRNEAKRLCEQYGQGVPTLGTGMAAGIDGLTFSDPDPGIRRKAMDICKEHLDLAAFLGSGVTIGLLWGKVGRDPKLREEGRKRAVDCIRELAPIAEQAGVYLFLEPLNRFECDYMNTVQHGIDVIEEVGAPSLRYLADTFHMNIEEKDIAESFRKLGDKLGHVHLVDSNREAPGHGHIDFKEILQTLKEIDYQGYLSFEILPLPDSRTAIEDAIGTTRQLLKSL